MTFVQIETRQGMVNLDGYSRNKTLKGALKDLAREVAKIDESEANAILNNLDETAEMASCMMNIPGAYYIEAEEVHCASRYSEKNDEMEYAEGRWYLYIRFCTPEQESKESKTSATSPVAKAEAIVGTDAEADSTESEEDQEGETLRYEIKRFGYDPFDIMCGDCPVHQIEWWEEATLKDLRNVHAEEMEMDASPPDRAVEDMMEQGLWNPTKPDFKEWLKKCIVSGYVRIAA